MKTYACCFCAALAIGCASHTKTSVSSSAPLQKQEIVQQQPAAEVQQKQYDEPVFPLSQVKPPPRQLTGAAPSYTLEMIQNNVEGVVSAQILVGRFGRVIDVVIVQHLGHGTDVETKKALMQYTFEPAMKDGKPVAVWIDMTVNFRPMRRQ
jgi:hypothetical protein